MDDLTVASWVLLAVGASAMEGDVLPDQVIGAADAINHAVLLRVELEVAVQILEGGGLLSTSGSTLRLTEAGRSELELADIRYWLESWTKLRNRLERLGIDRRSAWRIDPTEFYAAVETYLAQMAPKRKS